MRRFRVTARFHLHFALLTVLLLSLSKFVMAQATAFNYQGRLTDGGSPANGLYDLQFRLFDAVTAGNQVASTLVSEDVTVTNGTFSVSLDFGAAAFPGANRWLEIAVRPGASTSSFVALSPLQPITATPYAVQSLNATNAANATNALQLGSVAANQYVLTGDPRLSDARAPTPGSTNYIQNSTSPQTGNFNITGNGIIGGSVGVGTPSPQSNVHVSSTNTTSTSLTLENLVGQTSRQLILSNYGSTGGGLYWPGLNTANTSSLFAPNLLVVRGAGGLAFSGTSTAEHMRIHPDGNISIASSGIANARLTVGPSDVAGVQNHGVLASGNAGGIGVGGSSDTGSGVYGSSTSSNGVRGFSISGNGVYGTSQTGFAGYFDGKVAVNGNVGIGTSSPSAKLAVDAGGESIYAHSTSGYALHARSESTDAAYFEGSTHFTRWITLDELKTGGSTTLCLNGSNQISTCSSSLRYKTNVQSFDGGLDIIKRLRPIQFNWKDGESAGIGFAAEEVQKVEPLLTYRNNAGEIEGVLYDQLSAVFVNALKEQETKIEQQQLQIKQQQSQIDDLKTLVCLDHPTAIVCQ